MSDASSYFILQVEAIALRYQELLQLPRVRRIYLDELSVTASSVGLETIKLVVEPEETAVTKAKVLIEQVREEIEAMLGLGDIRQSLVYQEALEEGELKGKLETVPLMLKLGATVEQIAKDLDLNVEDVRKAAQENSPN